MASYKVPQDVEADDKLLGPFTFRQFIYLMIVFGMIVLAVALFQIFPLLAVIPIPIALFFVILALPIKKDQPMETYLAALVSFYIKPRKRFWVPGQSDSTILITAPKKTEVSRTRDITEEEAGHRLSFLAAIVDSEGHAIKNASSPMRDEFYAEAYNTTDMFDNYGTARLNRLITKEQEERHAEVVNQMRAALQNSTHNYNQQPITPISSNERVIQPLAKPQSNQQFSSSAVVQPQISPITQPQPTVTDQRMRELANNPDFSVGTIEQQANRIRKENESEVYVSLR